MENTINGNQLEMETNSEFSKSWDLRALPGIFGITGALAEGGENQMMTGSRVTGSKSLPKLTTLGTTRSAGPTSTNRM